MNSSNFEGGAEKPKDSKQEQSAKLNQLPEAEIKKPGILERFKNMFGASIPKSRD